MTSAPTPPTPPRALARSPSPSSLVPASPAATSPAPASTAPSAASSTAPSTRSGASLGAGLLFVVVMLGAMITLVVTIRGGAQAAHAAVTQLRADAQRSPLALQRVAAAGELEALAQALRDTASPTVRNYQAQAGTACLWVTLDDPSRTHVQAVATEQADRWVITSVSLTRECECPDPDFDAACRLR